jgi:hypothetical protein
MNNLGLIVENIQIPVPLSIFSSIIGKDGPDGIRENQISFNLNQNGYSCLSIYL